MDHEQLEVDVLFVGAGPASLAGALHLSHLIRDHNEAIRSGTKAGEKLEDLTLTRPSIVISDGVDDDDDDEFFFKKFFKNFSQKFF